MIALVLGAAFLVALSGTALVRRYALARRVLDIPNDRSSHSTPTPRGGGVSIVVAFAAGILVLAGTGIVAPRVAIALLGGGGIVALAGFLDDHGGVPPRWRLVAHFAGAVWALLWLGGLPPIAVAGHTIDLRLAGNLLAAVGLVWMLNLYNFMDGIDGIAGMEAVTACAGAVLVHLSRGEGAGTWAPPALLAAASLGFLLWNFPPARIFMGDAGSGFIGLVLGVLALGSAAVAPECLWSWLILVGTFVVDATITLVRRLQRRQSPTQAHRSHAYQHAALRVGAHGPVAVAVAAINLLWLFPLALAVGTGRLDGLLGLVIAYAPLAWLALRFGAGAPDQRASAV